MLMEAELRKYRDALKVLLKEPCNCAAEGHALECELGAMGMTIEIRVLAWVLGDDFEMGNKVERFIKAAKELRKNR